ncbi:MarR family winged helix-turn-helix transcriptional regulator [Bacillus testis]|uniref:MarR family winged helix-turn-helix transcriptional regulator n=1 Tax=Bacillus testis TaxID=1622072 RepID=UPI00067EA39B|nr:MarR family transcriptional regulator [Bacillus testis]
MLKDDIGFMATTTAKMLKAFISQELKSYHITSEQWTVLKQLSFVGDLNQKELAIRTDKDQATLTKILDLLEQRNLLARKANPHDRRSYLVEITEQGKQVVDEVLPFIENLYQSILAGISEEQLHDFTCVLEQMKNNIEQMKS